MHAEQTEGEHEVGRTAVTVSGQKTKGLFSPLLAQSDPDWLAGYT